MGIPAIFQQIMKDYPNILITHPNIKIDNFYLDCNSIIFDAVHENMKNKTIIEDSLLIRTVISRIESYISFIRPCRNILLAFDGIPPVAKLNQQRQRRFKSGQENKNSDWDTTAISPGTPFMQLLDKMIKEHFNNPDKFTVEKIILSGSGYCGEGEHKIFEFIRTYPELHAFNTVIYGLDADLIMLCLNHLSICNNNLWLFRELLNEAPVFLNIAKLAKGIEISMQQNNNEEDNNHDDNNNNNYVSDYILLCFFLGNDFLPHFPAINIRTGGIEKLLTAYKQLKKPLVRDKIHILWAHLKELVQFLSGKENYFLQKEMQHRNILEQNLKKQNNINNKNNNCDLLPLYERSYEHFIAPCTKGWENRYYRSLLNIEEDQKQIQDISVQYLQGLEWTLKYYSSGCPDWRWQYTYLYPPLLKDLVLWIPLFETELIFSTKWNLIPVSTNIQLAYILPNEKLRKFCPKIFNILAKKNNTSFSSPPPPAVWAFCKYLWEAHLILPKINISELEDLFGEKKIK